MATLIGQTMHKAVPVDAAVVREVGTYQIHWNSISFV